MVELIAIHTVQYLSNGKQAVAFPGSRFEMLDAEAESVIRQKAALYANPQDVVPVQAAIQLPATDAPVDAVAASEAELKAELEADVAEPEAAPKPAHVDAVAASEPELKAEPAAAPKRTRKAKAESTE